MRYFMLLMLLMLLACPVAMVADGDDADLRFDLTRLAVAISDLDLNGDTVFDRVLLVRNEAGDAVDLVAFISDPATGVLAEAEVVPAILPAGAIETRQDLQTIGSTQASEPGQPDGIVFWGMDGAFTAELVMHRTKTGWAVDRARYVRLDLMGRNAPECTVAYNAADDTSVKPSIVLGPYLWRDQLPEDCLKG